MHKIGGQYLEDGAPAIKFDSNTKVIFEIEEDIHQVRADLLSEQVLMKEISTFENYDYLLCDGEDPYQTVISNPS
ncbi:hypothetical protein HQN84_03830 [Pedobacter steynii]|uniref:hypothetical protein n=1 Tax=Pedobacter steynii TaxID=430522 RepID=UPI0011600964|nr:hypothetical protein [Pedobacter steynii]NQX37958.1 hypothetical protein [Pedobacter steynii]